MSGTKSGKGKGKGAAVRETVTPVPAKISGDAYYKVGRYEFTVGEVDASTRRAKLRDRVFHAYLELFFQAKHDDKIDAYCKHHHIECKKEKGTKVVREKGDDTVFGVYDDLGRVACDVVCNHMAEVWANNVGGPASEPRLGMFHSLLGEYRRAGPGFGWGFLHPTSTRNQRDLYSCDCMISAMSLFASSAPTVSPAT